MKYVAQQISPVYRTIYFSQLLKTNLLSETIISHAQPAFIWLNSAILIKCKIEVNNKSTRCHSVVFTVNFEYI